MTSDPVMIMLSNEPNEAILPLLGGQGTSWPANVSATAGYFGEKFYWLNSIRVNLETTFQIEG